MMARLLCTRITPKMGFRRAPVQRHLGQIQSPKEVPPIKEGESRSPSQYLSEGKGVRHVADQHLSELPAEISALNPIQVGVHPVDPVKEKRWPLTTRAREPSPALGEPVVPS